MAATWIPIEASQLAKHVRAMAEKDEDPVGFTGGWSLQDNQHSYWNIAYFVPPGVPKDRATLAVVAFDDDYLRKDLLAGHDERCVGQQEQRARN